MWEEAGVIEDDSTVQADERHTLSTTVQQRDRTRATSTINNFAKTFLFKHGTSERVNDAKEIS